MSEPALLLEATSADGVDPVLAEEARHTFASGWTSLRERLRADPPEEASAAESAAIGEMGHLIVSVIEKVGVPFFGRLLGSALKHGVETAWRHEYEATVVERKLGMRLVSEALATLLDLLATKLPRIQLPADLGGDVMHSAIDQVASWPKPLRSLYRLELFTFIAFDLANGADTDEFCAWARRAASAGRSANADWHDFSLTHFEWQSPATPGDEGLVIVPAESASAVIEALENPAEPNANLIALFRDG